MESENGNHGDLDLHSTPGDLIFTVFIRQNIEFSENFQLGYAIRQVIVSLERLHLFATMDHIESLVINLIVIITGIIFIV